MTREEVLIEMVKGKVFEGKDGSTYRMLEGGNIIGRNERGDQFYPSSVKFEDLKPIEEKKEYWLWVNTNSGGITNYRDENGFTPEGVGPWDSFKEVCEKLEWSKIEL